MRFLHTGDWHLDKPLRGRSRLDEYERALAEVLEIAEAEQVDAVLVAGDTFDTATPSAEAERLFYREFLVPLYRRGMRAVLVAGNHDHPQRLVAIQELLSLMNVDAVAVPLTCAQGGVIRLPARDGSEVAHIACLPWVNPGRVLDQADWLSQEGQPFQGYSDRVGAMVRHLATGFRPDTVNLLVGHLMLDGAEVGPGGGERPLHLGQTYAISAQQLPPDAHYVALGHVHRPQQVSAPCPTRYAGSLFQLDFGERDQTKSVTIVEAHPGTPAVERQVPLSSGRALRDLHVRFEDLPSLAEHASDNAFFRVVVSCDQPASALAERVREALPSTLHVVAEITRQGPQPDDVDGNLGPEALLTSFHQERFRADPRPELLELFRDLLAEASHETP